MRCLRAARLIKFILTTATGLERIGALSKDPACRVNHS